ncbi:MAG: exopolysaccharide production repressor protein [Rhizobiaceae bacterium]|nr:exopolysaccharide production repressor protein [Rhizobiaceae bacterium]
MPFVLFLRGMMSTLLVFGVTTYVLSGSLWTTTWQTALCAVIIQVGYFIGILFMVWQAGGDAMRAEAMTADVTASGGTDETAAGSSSRVPGIRLPGSN